MLSKEGRNNLSSLGSLAKTFKELSEKIKDPAVQKRFAGNVFLLMGQHQLTITKLAELASCSQSTMCRLLSGKGKFVNTNPLTFASIAFTLGVDANTLLFVDLREKFSEFLAKLQP
jgi:hypothetical protein